MPSNFKDVRDFHVKYKLPFDFPPMLITLMPPEVFGFRHKFLLEEHLEFVEATRTKSLVKAVDSLIDFVYVAFGTVLFMGAGEHSVHADFPFPDFERTKARASQFGLLAGAAPRPTLLEEKTLELISGRMGNEVHLFELSHGLETLNSIPLSLAALWNAAWQAYYGAALMGVNAECWAACWGHVHQKNMEKVRADESGSNSVRKSSWDVVKPEGWTPPDPLIKVELERWTISNVR